jgi:hypothetical protein
MELRHEYEIREKLVTPGQYDLEFYKSYNYEESKYYKINHYPSEHKPDFFRRIYKDKEFLSPMSYSTMSRYETINTLKDVGKSYHVTNRKRFIKRTDGDIYYEVTNMTENRLDLISLIHYNTPIYWWIIAEANYIVDSFNDVYRGMILRIPPLMSALSKYTK